MLAPLDEEIDYARLGDLVHKLSISLLTAKCRVGDQIGHIFDITVPMALYKGNGIYQTALCATRYCAQMQYCLRSVVIHIARLGGPYGAYVPFDSTKKVMPDPAIDEDEDSEELDVVDGVYSSRCAESPDISMKEPLHFVDNDSDDSADIATTTGLEVNANADGDRLLL